MSDSPRARSVRAVDPPHREDLGDLVTRRPVHPLERLNPFLFINHHGPQTYPAHNHGLPFGPHPHRGFETLTFIVDGSLVHRDSAAHESEITAGGVQWMTAGRGIEHSETSSDRFLEEGGALEILQLWMNLPARLKMTEPRYIGLQEEAIPSLSLEGGAKLQLISGELDGVRGAVEAITGTMMSTIEVPAGATVTLPAPAARVVFLYVVQGEIEIAETTVPRFHLAELANDGDAVQFRSRGGALVIFGHAEPLAEPIAAYGPFVMNDDREIAQAVRDYQAGLFR